jgi:hypothetical protein
MKTIPIIQNTPLRTIMSVVFAGCIVAAFIAMLIVGDNSAVSGDKITLILIVIALISGAVMGLSKGHKQIGTLTVEGQKVHFNLDHEPDFEKNSEDVYFHILTHNRGDFRWWTWIRDLIPQFAGKKNYIRFEKDGHGQRLELHIQNDRSHELMNDIGIKNKSLGRD